MSNDVLVALLGGGGFATIFTAIVVGLFNRRKLGADATEIITKAASGVVTRLEAELVRKQATHDEEMHELRAEVDRLKESWNAERESWRRVNQAHVAFDYLAIAKLAEAGIDLGMEVPPLLPPVQADLS